jgi:hypothetical protein
MSEGYVGITKDLSERIRGHRRNKHQTPLVCFLKSTAWSDIEIEMMDQSLSLQEALLAEAYYRPTQMIGLNLQMGGELGVEPSWYNIPENKEKHRKATSEATKLAISKKDTKEARSKRALKIHSERPDIYRGIQAGSKNGRAILDEKQVKEIKSLLITDKTTKEIANIFDVKHCVINNIRYNRTWKHITCDSLI